MPDFSVLDNNGCELVFREDISFPNAIDNLVPACSVWPVTNIMTVLETERLILRNINDNDFDELYRMNSDPLIMKYVGDGSTRNHEQMTQELAILISHYTRKPGLGIWATILKDTNTFVGASGLVYYDNTPEIEIGYRLLKEHWNKGYATEASIGLLKYGFKKIGLRKIVSSAHVENFASRKVMEKIGMRHIDNRVHYSCLQAYYEIEADTYQALYNPS